MQNFSYYNPTRIVFGEGSVSRLDDLIPRDARVLVLYGGASAQKNGTLDEVRAALGPREVQEFGGIEPNPTYETLMKAVAQVSASRIDFLLAVGGGSVIDGTKFVAAAVLFDGEPWSIMETHGANVHAALPFGSVLTLPATGSEMNSGGVVTRRATHAKLSFRSEHVFPAFSILDPTKSYTLPARQIANGVVDAFVHIVEQYLTYPADGLAQDRFAEGLLQTLVEIGPEAFAERHDYAVRANLMWVATLALNGLIGAGVPQDWATHMVGHELTARYDIDHARTLAVVLPSMLQVRRDSKRGKLLQYAERVWNITDGAEDARIDAAIARTRAFFESLDVKTRLADYGVGVEAIDQLVAQLDEHGMTQLGEHKDVTLDVSRRVLEGAL
ncbi:iron-containing alcohol dehydrogenase [Burkholderia vietnamiensis]|uniref:Iron-containing alcohol dehydrogenase n=1 Tax=Burkholderia vietnamiensis TaxID=60552 RepID=A0AAW7SZ63_BURVI|nr:iron-containing alcohol dehydrogenase [Burkholderia vietnamiensis]MBH9645827.1 iron-containing alcohol dehydrogenase [Burkholderia vietnamiensis]MBR8010526.1 iron-containing alcohol dehydrogenase [Burkholderia vietnamiensis]MDN7551280.1 iron-containing alcohol dehydrogenase [Burkholderia vietnamiensis]MDN7795094.1 iron-containing alcohol dehydrogenase [Burkholderia vietnamiensis]MDN8043606.1 iron-containing alcohol dehydrogenase [Burkholderia vietnamiensis]